MPSPYDLLPNSRPHRTQIEDATISASQPAPASFTDPLYVVPAWNGQIFWQIDDWGAIHGSALPAQGAACLVVVSNTGTRRVIWWAGETVPW